MCLPIKPFKIEREWKHAGLSCAVVQADEGRHRCGYVRVPLGHPMHAKGYDEPMVDVHGGLTFAEKEPCNTHEDGEGWWFGFDCYHSGDAGRDPNVDVSSLSDGARKLYETMRDVDARFPIHSRGHYWTQPEVETETESLAEQLAGVAV
jgi:hypothetical protein